VINRSEITLSAKRIKETESMITPFVVDNHIITHLYHHLTP
jgi:hypothetical protein